MDGEQAPFDPDRGDDAAGVPDASAPDTELPDEGVPDEGVPDAAVRAAGAPVAAGPVAGVPGPPGLEERVSDAAGPAAVGPAAGVPDAWPGCGVSDAVAGLDLVRRGAALVQAAPLLALSDAELREVVAAAVAARAAVDAGYLHTLAALEGRGPGAVPGASASAVAATFLIHATNTAPVQAGRDVRAAAALAGDGSGIVPADEDALVCADATNAGGWLPRVGAAFAAGLVSRGHVDVAIRCLARIPKRLLSAVDEEGRSGIARVDAFLAEHARQLTPPDLDRVAAQLVAVLDPDAADGPDPDARRRRFLSLRTGPDGMLHGSFALDAAAGAVVKAAIELVVKEQVGRPDPGATAPRDPAAAHDSDPDGVHEGHPAGARDSDEAHDRDEARDSDPDTGQGDASDGDRNDGDDTRDGEQEVLPISDDRSVGQRRADALHQVCLDALRGGRTGAPTGHVSVVATPDQLRDAIATTLDQPRAWPASRPAAWWPEPAPDSQTSFGPRPEHRTGPQTEPRSEPDTGAEASTAPEPGVEPGPAPWADSHIEPQVEPGTEPERSPWTDPALASWTEPGAEPEVEPWAEPEVEPWTECEVGQGVEPGCEPEPEPEVAPTSGSGGSAVTPPGPGPRRAAGLATDDGGTPLAPAVLAQLLCGALLTPVLLDAHGAVLDLGRTTRLATAVQRRALTARDRGCVVPGCAVPAAGCEAHHVVWWRDNGCTDVTNLALLCARHHSAVHSGHWQLRMIDGLPYVIAPPWADPTGTPRRNTLHTATSDAHRLGQHLRDAQLHLDLPGCDRAGSSPPDHDPRRRALHDHQSDRVGDPPGGDAPEPQVPQRE